MVIQLEVKRTAFFEHEKLVILINSIVAMSNYRDRRTPNKIIEQSNDVIGVNTSLLLITIKITYGSST